MKQKISITMDGQALKSIDAIIDNIYIRNRSQAIEYLVKNALGENKTAVILAGGSEAKLKISPTEYRLTARLKSRTVIEHAIIKLRQCGFRNIILIARHLVLTAAFDIVKDGSAYGVKVSYIEEKESKGTAATLKLIKGKVATDFIVVYGHIIFDKVNLEELWNQHIRHEAVATLMLTTSAEPSEKGTVRMEGSRILNFVQKPKQSEEYLVFSPIFAAEPELLDYDGNSLEYDIFPMLAEKGLLQGHMSSEKEQHIHTKEDVEKLR
ncbi:MAG: sugar phosphate nucleotidyltransferase [Candidatus Woesearchaeota archaeon]